MKGRWLIVTLAIVACSAEPRPVAPPADCAITCGVAETCWAEMLAAPPCAH